MDPLTHTFVGAALSESGLGRRTRFAAAALIIGANLPDIDGLSYFWGGDVALGFRRGWTHGLLLAALQPFLLSGLLVAIDRLRPRSPSRASFTILLWLSAIAVATHPFLDWLNTYGVRFLMPFDPRWFYGDGLFVIDPYGWLMLGGAVFLARPFLTIWERIAWGLAAGLTSLVILGSPFTPRPARWAWVAGLLVLAGLRLVLLPRRRPRLSLAGLGLMSVYIAMMLTSSAAISSGFRAGLEAGGVPATYMTSWPAPFRQTRSHGMSSRGHPRAIVPARGAGTGHHTWMSLPA